MDALNRSTEQSILAAEYEVQELRADEGVVSAQWQLERITLQTRVKVFSETINLCMMTNW